MALLHDHALTHIQRCFSVAGSARKAEAVRTSEGAAGLRWTIEEYFQCAKDDLQRSLRGSIPAWVAPHRALVMAVAAVLKKLSAGRQSSTPSLSARQRQAKSSASIIAGTF
jgi:hypothetical protein